MPRKIDLTNQRFGKWTVLYECAERKNHNIYWHCKCDCGAERDVRGGDLRFGSSTSCGCIQKEKVALQNSLDLIGQKFKRLTVIEKTNKRKDGMIVWKCQCDCGNVITTPTSYLTSGDTGSCGCLQLDRIRETSAKDIRNQRFGKLIALEPTEKRQQKNVVWKCQCDCGSITYISTHTLLSGGTRSCGCTKSHGEEKISNILKNYNIEFTVQQCFDSCRFEYTNKLAVFDFWVDNKYLIEYDGQQHFTATGGWNTLEHVQQVQERDKYKTEWCRNNNIPLIRIPYTQYEKLDLEDLLLESSKFRVV